MSSKVRGICEILIGVVAGLLPLLFTSSGCLWAAAAAAAGGWLHAISTGVCTWWQLPSPCVYSACIPVGALHESAPAESCSFAWSGIC